MLGHTRDYKNIVVGGNLSALLYSFYNNVPIIINNCSLPHPYDFFKPDVDLTDFLIENVTTKLNSNKTAKVVGLQKQHLRNNLFFLLSMSGLMLYTEEVESIRIESRENKLKVVNGAVGTELKFDKLLIFNDDKLNLLPAKKRNKYLVLDWMEAKSCDSHLYDFLNINDGNFAKEIYFYSTTYGNRNRLVVVSHLSEKELENYKNSDIYSRFKTENFLKSLGIRGKDNGFYTGKRRHYLLRLEVAKREIFKSQMDLHENTENLTFLYDPPEKIIKESHLDKTSYQYKLLSLMKK